MRNFKTNPINYLSRLLVLSFLFYILVACEREIPDDQIQVSDFKINKAMDTGPYELPGSLIFDITATPDGSIMMGVNRGPHRSVEEIRNGEVRKLFDVDVSTDINGIVSLGSGKAFFTTAGTDLAKDGELYSVTNGNYKMVADLGEFEEMNDPDANEGIMWKNQLCEYLEINGNVIFNAGPQNNPYKLTMLDPNTTFIADAAGNTLLMADKSGDVDWKAIFTPPLNDAGEFMELFQIPGENENISCYVQPVPTSVVIGPDGYLYVGELTGAIGPELPTELSRIWKIPLDATNVTCNAKDPNAENCMLFKDGLTSIIDMEIGPDGRLYVVELDENSWMAIQDPTVDPIGGTITAFDLDGDSFEIIEENLTYPSAITFDKKGNLWILENKLFIGGAAVVRMLE